MSDVSKQNEASLHYMHACVAKIPRAEVQYLNGLRYIKEWGYDVENKRTGHTCRTLIGINTNIDAQSINAPILTTRKLNVKIAIAELLGYIRGYTSAAQFRELGTNTWNANANENLAWLNNPNRVGEDDMGFVYGAVAKNWPVDGGKLPSGNLDLFKKVYTNLKSGIDDRGEIITFWNPGVFDQGCLRPCMHTHQFSLLGDHLFLHSFQRSNDWCLGFAANMIQVYLLLRLMAQITGHQAGVGFHTSVNSHIYDNQLPLVDEQLSREILAQPTIEINPDIKTLEDLETWVSLDDFKITYDQFHEPIKYPFAV